MASFIPTRENVPDHLTFEQKAKECFADLLERFGYRLVETVSKPNYVRLTYRNRLRLRKLVVENQTFPVDYGFSMFIYKLLFKDYQIIYNIPWEKQDKECLFLDKATQRLSKNKRVIEVIKGQSWQLKRDDIVQE